MAARAHIGVSRRRRLQQLERELTAFHAGLLELGHLEKTPADLRAEAAIFERYDDAPMARLLRLTADELEG